MLRTVVPLLLLYADRKRRVKGRTRLQKLVFLAQKRHSCIGNLYHYVPLDFGPYSFDLQSDIDDLIRKEVIEEVKKDVGDGRVRFEYKITGRGEFLVKSLLKSSWGHRLGAILDALEDLKRNFKGVSLDSLIREVYSDFPEYAVRSQWF